MEYKAQRLYRDARILSIYEGTTQLQVVAAIRYVTNGTYLDILREFEQEAVIDELKPLQERIIEMTNKFEAATNLVKEAGNQELLDILARSLYEMAAVNVMANLLLTDASRAPELFAKSAKVYVNLVESEVEKHFKFINSFKAEDLEAYKQ